MTWFDRLGGFLICSVLTVIFGPLALVTSGNPTPLAGSLVATLFLGPGWWWMHASADKASRSYPR